MRNRNKLYTIASEIPAKARERETLIFPDKKGNKSIKSGWFAGDKFAVKERSLPTLTCGEISPTGGSSYVCVCVCVCVCGVSERKALLITMYRSQMFCARTELANRQR